MTTIKSIAGGNVDKITIHPMETPNGTEWVVYIPPTRLDHFEGGQDADPLESDILGPWEASYWPTLTAAVGFLAQCVASGDIVSNDGVVLR